MTQEPQNVQDFKLRRTPHGRMTTTVAFELPITEQTIEELLEGEGGDPNCDNLPQTAIEPDLLAIIRSELADAEFGLFSADSGRGASGYAVALEVLSMVADIGGTVAFSVGAIQLTKRLFGKLRERMGSGPLVSLGAACHLAAADMVDRAGTVEFTLHGAGDTRSRAIDYSYTGNDCFFVIFERSDDLYFYAVDAHGRVTFLGIAKMPPRYW